MLAKTYGIFLIYDVRRFRRNVGGVVGNKVEEIPIIVNILNHLTHAESASNTIRLHRTDNHAITYQQFLIVSCWEGQYRTKSQEFQPYRISAIGGSKQNRTP